VRWAGCGHWNSGSGSIADRLNGVDFASRANMSDSVTVYHLSIMFGRLRGWLTAFGAGLGALGGSLARGHR
jgi:hypothetical protein